MDKQKLVKKLKEFIEKNKLKNSKVETDLGLPKNSLSNFISEKKALPDKWINPIMKYTLGDLADKVITADKIEMQKVFDKALEENPNPKQGAYEDSPESKEFYANMMGVGWIAAIEKYCEKEGITPEDLILSHKERNTKKGTNTSKEGEIGFTEAGSAKNNHSNWFETYRGTKTGITKHKA